MDRHILWFLMGTLFAVSTISHAELRLDPSIKPKQIETTLKPLLESVVRPYGERNSADFGGLWGKSGVSPFIDGSNFAWIFNGKRFLSNVATFTPEIVALEDCKPNADELNPGHQCDRRRSGFKVCHLFLFNDKDLQLEGVVRLNIVRDRKQLLGLPRCHGIEALAAVKTIADAMLVTMSYIDSAERSDKHYDPPEYYSTALLRFRNENGKLKVEQDDNCLGNPNNYKTIAAARKALEACARSQKQRKG